MSAKSPEYLSVQEVGKFLGIERKTVYRLILRGELPAVKVGKMYRIYRDDLASFLEAKKSRIDLPNEARTSTYCSFCGVPVLSPLDIGGHCQQCGAPLCTACWNFRTRRCQEHSLPDPVVFEHNSKPGENNLIICGSCRKVIPSEHNIGGYCLDEGCNEPLCQECWNHLQYRYCLHHAPSLVEKLQSARERLAAGQIPCLVTSVQARRMEIHFIYRFDRKVQAIDKLQNPLTGHTLSGLSWHKLRHEEDQSAILMSLLGVGFLDRKTLGRLPVNMRVWYEIKDDRVNERLPGSSVVFEARVISRLEEHVREGFDTRPLELEELHALLEEYLEMADRTQSAYIVGLASTTGWDQQALDFVSSSQFGQTFSHPLIMPCLINLTQMSLSYDSRDNRMKGFVPIFGPLLFEEEVQLAMEDIRRTLLLSPGTLSLQQLREELPQYREEVILQAAKHLQAQGTHVIEELENIGLVISERR